MASQKTDSKANCTHQEGGNYSETGMEGKCNKPHNSEPRLNDNRLNSSGILQGFKHSDDKKVTNMMEGTQINQMIHDIDQARKTGLFCDVTLLVGPEGHPINAHRLVLCSASDYFKAMFNTDLKERSQDEVELPMTDLSTMQSLLDFAYTSKIKVTDKNIEKITSAANFYSMPKLLKMCVNYIEERIDISNSIEVLEFAEHISSNDLKAFAKNYIIQNFDAIATRNLDIMEMSPSLLLEITANNETALCCGPTENEERLFQIGWNNLHSQPDNVWNTLIPKLLKAVHLPQVTDEFLKSITRKVSNHQEAMALVEEAKIKKSTIQEYKPTKEMPVIDGNLQWCMKRSGRQGQISVRCGGIKNKACGSDRSKSYGEPALIGGVMWCLYTDVRNPRNCVSDNERFLSCFVQCLDDLQSKSVMVHCKMEMIVTGKQKGNKSNHTKEYVNKIFDKNMGKGKDWGWPQFIEFENVLEKYYDAKSDSCLITADLTVEPVSAGEESNNNP